MSNIQPETKQQFEAVSAPEGLPPLRLRLVVGGIVTVVALTEFGASKPARADHETEEGEGIDCDYGFHARWAIDDNEDGQPGPSPEEYGCFTIQGCGPTLPPIALAEGDPDLTPQQTVDYVAASKMQCKGDPHPNYDEWFEANPWAQPYRVIIEEEATTPEDSTTETEPEPVVEPVTEPEATEDTTPEEVVDEQQPDTGTTTTETEPDQPEPVVEPVTEPEATEDTTPEEVVDEQQPDTGTTTTETEPDQPEPVVEPVTEPEATEDTSPEEEVVDEQQPDTGTTTTETEPDQPEPVVEPTEPEATSTTALVEQQPPDTETDTDTSVLPDVLVVGTIGAVALSSIYLFKAKKIKIPSRLKRNPRR